MIKFIQDYRGVLTDEVFYRKGDTIDHEHADELVNQGRAVYIDQVNDAPAPKHAKTQPVLGDLSDEELRALAKERGIPNFWRMKRSTLVKKLRGKHA